MNSLPKECILPRWAVSRIRNLLAVQELTSKHPLRIPLNYRIWGTRVVGVLKESAGFSVHLEPCGKPENNSLESQITLDRPKKWLLLLINQFILLRQIVLGRNMHQDLPCSIGFEITNNSMELMIRLCFDMLLNNSALQSSIYSKSFINYHLLKVTNPL